MVSYSSILAFCTLSLGILCICRASNTDLEKKFLLKSQSDDEIWALFKDWKGRNHRSYDDNNSLDEELKRFNIFKENVRYISAHNAKNSSFWLGPNKFTDLTNEEYKAMYLMGPKRKEFTSLSSSSKYHIPFKFESNSFIPSSVDWRQNGSVTPPKDQGSCGEFHPSRILISL